MPSPLPTNRNHDAQAGTAALLRRSDWPACALAVVLIVANWPLVSGRECPPFDAYSQFGLYHHIVGAFARAGQFMTWNPWSNAGSPDFADPQFGAYSPFVIGTAFLANGAEWGFRVYWLSMWYLGGLGMILLGRHLGIPRWACFAVATGYAFNGFYTGHAEHTVSTYAYSGLPWTIWRADVAMRRRRFADAAQAGALLGLSALGGYPGMVIASASYTTLWTLGRAITGRRELIPSLARWMSVMSIIAMVFGMVAAASYVPFFVDAAGYSGRTGPLPREVAVTSGAYLPWALETFASPAIAPLDFDRRPDPSLRSVYLGTLIPALALIALARPLRRRSAAARAGLGFGALQARYGINPWLWWLAGLAVLSLMVALSTIFPLRGWLYDFLFPFRYFRQSSLFRAYLIFSVAVLALYGCRDAAARLRERRRGLSPALLLVISLPALTALIVAHLVFSGHPGMGEAVRTHVLVMWLLPVVAAAIIAIARTRRRSALLIATLVIFASVDAVWSAAISGPLLHATNDVWYRSSELRYMDLDLTRRGLARRIESLDNNNLWHKIPALRSYTPLQNVWFERLARHPVFERAATQADRIFFTTAIAQARLDEADFTAMLDRATQLNAPVLVIASPWRLEDLTPIAALPAATPIAVHVDRYLPDELVFTTTTPTGGWLLVTDRWALGWQVWVNGMKSRLAPADFVFRAVQVPAGRVQVRFTYETTYGLSFVALSWTTLAALLIALPMARATRVTRW